MIGRVFLARYAEKGKYVFFKPKSLSKDKVKTDNTLILQNRGSQEVRFRPVPVTIKYYHKSFDHKRIIRGRILGNHLMNKLPNFIYSTNFNLQEFNESKKIYDFNSNPFLRKVQYEKKN